MLQHFEPIKRFGGLDEFIKIQERDEQKYRQCIENGIIKAKKPLIF